MAYNLSAVQNASSIPDLVFAADGLANNMLVILFMLAIWITALLVLKRYSFLYAWIASSAGCFVLASLLALGGFLHIIWPLGFLAAAAFGLLYVYAADHQG